MDGLTWLDLDGMRVLRADYGVAKDPIQLMHAIKKEQYLAEGDCIYSLTDFGQRVFSEVFIKEYGVTSRDLVSAKRIVAAYTGLTPELFHAAKEIISSLVKEKNATIEFFETEPAAIEWLLSFKACEEKEPNFPNSFDFSE
jgi:hypothetical protein